MGYTFTFGDVEKICLSLGLTIARDGRHWSGFGLDGIYRRIRLDPMPTQGPGCELATNQGHRTLWIGRSYMPGALSCVVAKRPRSLWNYYSAPTASIGSLGLVAGEVTLNRTIPVSGASSSFMTLPK